MNHKDQGLTLVEVVIALMLFSIVVAFTVPIFGSAHRLNQQSQTLLYAQNKGQEAMELWIDTAAQTQKAQFKPTPGGTLVGFSLCSYHNCPPGEFNVNRYDVYYKRVDSYDLFILTDNKSDQHSFTLQVYLHGVLTYEAKDWLHYAP